MPLENQIKLGICLLRKEYYDRFSCRFDGAQFFKSRKTSIWPIYLIINEIPYKQRTKENMILASLWSRNKKPSMGTYLNAFSNPLTKFNSGIQCQSPDKESFYAMQCYYVDQQILAIINI